MAKSDEMPDGKCRRCHDKRKSKNANGEYNGRTKTKCLWIDGSCIGRELPKVDHGPMDAYVTSKQSQEGAADAGATAKDNTAGNGRTAANITAPSMLHAPDDTSGTAAPAAAPSGGVIPSTAATAADAADATADAAAPEAGNKEGIAPKRRHAAHSASPPSRKSSRAGGEYGSASMERRREEAASKKSRQQAAEAAAAATPTEVSSAKDEQIGLLQQEVERLTARAEAAERAIAARETAEAEAREAAEAKASDARATERRVQDHLRGISNKLIDDAQSHNRSLAIPDPLMKAAIRSGISYARQRAAARASQTWQPSNQFAEIAFTHSSDNLAGGRPELETFMVAGCIHKIIDWREVCPSIRFFCDACKTAGRGEGEMVVSTHNPDPDGLRRDVLSCTAMGKVGLTREFGAGRRTVMSSVQLRCTSKACSHSDCMHSPNILAMLPKYLADRYYCDLVYSSGMQVHISRELSNVAEPLFIESETSLAGLIAAIDESYAREYERAMMMYHVARRAHIDSLSADPVAAQKASGELPTLTALMQVELFGQGISVHVLSERIEQKLVDDTPIRAKELQSLGSPQGGLLHLCSDDNDAIAKAVQIAGGNDGRKLHLSASAHTGLIYSAALVPGAHSPLTSVITG